MIKTLVQIAKELNVGTSSIVEHLNKRGFQIDNKPNAKISEEMFAELLKEFQSSLVEKEKADQILIGTRPAPVKKETPAPLTPLFSKTATPQKEEVRDSKPAAPVQKEEPEAPAPEEETTERAKPQLKILGKINLDTPRKSKPKTEPAPTAEENGTAEEKSPETGSEPAEEHPMVTTPAAKTEPTTESTEETTSETPEAEGADQEELHRIEAPQLKGLKILGKIDTDKFSKKKKKKEPEPAPPAAARVNAGADKGESPAADSASEEEKRKRKRKRKKVASPTTESKPGLPDNKAKDAGRNKDLKLKLKSRKDDVKEISQKEIDEQIKATMARLSAGSKNKRQKIRRDKRDEMRERQEQREMEESSGKLMVTEFISVSELASVMDVPVTDVIMTCMNLGYMVSINQRLDAEIIEVVAGEFGHEVEFISAEDQLVEIEEEEQDDEADLEPRAPIVTVMGHVDHGKTSLLDYIRNANVAGGEAGGITQHIGAYEVVHNGKKITFLDTPGHEAFTAMRARGAKVTDVAVVIIAADDNIMPQTKEAISHAQAAGVPIVFAINKIDKPGADPDRIKQELANMNLLVEEWGGKYQSQDISAKKGVNVDLLLEKILLEAELLDLKANPERKANGTVIEASLDKGRGYVTKILVQNGTLHMGDAIVAGEYAGKVKAMFNERGQKTKNAGPSTPVLVLGLSGAPQAGEKFKVMTEADARQVAAKRAQITREQATRANKRISLDEIGRRLALGTFKELNLIVKGDVDGSIEALSDSLIKLSIEKVQVNVIHKAVGQITESDVLLASASDAVIIGFQVRPSLNARKLAEREGVQIKLYSIIYEAINEIKAAIEGMLEPTKEEKIVAQLEVREVYKISKIGTIAGCYVQEGKLTRNTHVRLIRDGIVVFPTREGAAGELGSLKRFKEDVKEVKTNMECGLTIKNFNDIKEGDVIEGFEIIEVKQKLD